MQVPLYIMKVGGSVCTKKAENKPVANAGLIARVAREIRLARNVKKFKLIIVHGAGPFGHSNVKNYGINEGIRTEKHVEGFIKTHLAMAKLNDVFLKEFESEGLKVITLDPTACIVQKNKKILKFDTTQIELLFKMDSSIIPIIYGDMVLDTVLKGSVVSGDAIIPYLARKLKAEKVLLGTDVAGIFTADPKKFPKAERISEINVKNFAQVLKSVTGSKAVDVTGGMKGKLEKLKEQLKGTKAFVFDMQKHESTFKALVGLPVEGTEVML